MKNIILYHANCADGFAAAFAAWLKFGDDAEYIPVQYGQPVPEAVARPSRPCQEPSAAASDDKGGTPLLRSIYILDFSYPAAVLVELAGRPDVEMVVVLDHHKTAQADRTGLPTIEAGELLGVRFDLTKSGAVLAWEYFHPDKPVPPFCLYVQDRDLWKWELEWSREINAGLWRGTERTFEEWHLATKWMSIPPAMNPEEITGRMAYEFKQNGEAILRSDALMLTELSRSPEQIVGPGGEMGLRVNSPVLQSELAERLLAEHPLHEYAEVWYERGGHLIHSLRSRPGGVDVSAIAKRHGGGGHPCAAGFSLPLDNPESSRADAIATLRASLAESPPGPHDPRERMLDKLLKP